MGLVGVFVAALGRVDGTGKIHQISMINSVNDL